MSHHKVRAHCGKLSEFEKGRIIGLYEAGWENWRIARHMDRRDAALEDAGKNGKTLADFSFMMVAVDLGPQKIRRAD
ncbi:hypothetical protein TNCV_3687671 [Trichonephila clavipes]|nr:hypothetical protein TNCV_3687671 [Trichonephila clavipes]